MLKNLARFRKAKDGVAAIEFALILPVLTALTLGVIEVTSALECRQRVTAMTATAADLVAQYTQITTAQMNDVLAATTAELYPFTASGAKITLTSIISDGNGNGKVAWSKGSAGATLRTTNTTVTLPTGLMAAYTCSAGVCTGCASGACSVILSEVSYNYASYSNTTKFITRSLTLSDRFYAKPRRSATVGFGP
jgi:Flp pilus assembly protein TadG